MDFGILGPLTIADGGVPFPTMPRKPRILLAMLLRRTNTTVSADRLIQALWGERAPSTARNTLHVHVHRLRQALGPKGRDRVQFRSPGYSIAVGAGELDAQVFADLAEQGKRAHAGRRYAACSELLRRALALWRAPPFADLPGGLDPGTELRRLEQAIITADDGLDLHAGGSAAPVRGAALGGRQRAAPVCQLPADTPDLTGRAEQVSWLCRLLTGDGGATPRGVAIAAVAGMGGVGKTALAVHVAHLLRERFPDGQLFASLRGAEPTPADPAQVLGASSGRSAQNRQNRQNRQGRHCPPISRTGPRCIEGGSPTAGSSWFSTTPPPRRRCACCCQDLPAGPSLSPAAAGWLASQSSPM
jgi:hypothetical protein